MSDNRTTELLSAYTERLIGRSENKLIDPKGEEHIQLAPLFKLAEQLNQNLQPVQPSAAFVRSLGQELVDSAKRQIAVTKRLRRSVLIGAAALGSLLSIASVVGAVVFVIVRLRARAHTRVIQAPTA